MATKISLRKTKRCSSVAVYITALFLISFFVNNPYSSFLLVKAQEASTYTHQSNVYHRRLEENKEPENGDGDTETANDENEESGGDDDDNEDNAEREDDDDDEEEDDDGGGEAQRKARLATKKKETEKESEDIGDEGKQDPEEAGTDDKNKSEEEDEGEAVLDETSRMFREADTAVVDESDAALDNKPGRESAQKEAHQPFLAIAPDVKVFRGNISQPKVAWLMSFPNSGTSFTLHMTREASNTTTATNYAGEGDIKDLPSEQVIEGRIGEQGPFLELIRNRYTNIPQYILTKTHCAGFCSKCGPYKLLFETPRSFMRGCLSGTKAVRKRNGIELVETMYNPLLVTKAIHIFRHPLDNIVARFHLEFNEEQAASNTKYVERYPKNAAGFQAWCARSDKTRDLMETRYLDETLQDKLQEVPCFNELFKYVQWHNMAFYTTHEMNLDVLYMHYHEYDQDFEKARDKVLKFLELPLVGTGVEFHSGKVYRHYYSREDKIAIRDFIQEYASRDTWNMIKGYDFEIDAPTTAEDKPKEMVQTATA